MPTILIAAYGSRGDIAPLTDIGCRLRESGHAVALTTNTDLVDDIKAVGLDARPVDFQLDSDLDADNEEAIKLAMQMVKPRGMRQLGSNMLAAIEDVPADLVLLTPFAELAGHPYAEARGIPSMGLRLQPLSATRAFPPALLGAWSAGGLVNRAVGRSATRWVDRIYGRTIAGFRDQLGLPRRSARRLRRDRTRTQWPIMHGFSPTVLPRPADWRPGLDVAGYWWPATTPGWEPPADLAAFLQAGSAPVFVGFGSLMVPPKETTRLNNVVRDALHSAGVRGVVQSGGAELAVAGDDQIISIGPVPYDWLFPRTSVVVHSCGAGTMASGLRAGIPAVGVPSPGGDQPFWARRLQHLGVSPATLPRPKLTAERLAGAVRAAIDEPMHKERAMFLANRIEQEDGGRTVVQAVEQRMAQPVSR